MDYYGRKEAAIELMVGLVKKGEFTKEQIIFTTQKETAMSDKFCKNFIKEGIDTGQFKIDENKGVIYGS